MLLLNWLSFATDIFNFSYNNFLKVHSNVKFMTIIQEAIYTALTVQSSLQIQDPTCFYDFLICENLFDMKIKDWFI